MDPNIILMRLGRTENEAAAITNSTPVSSVNHGDKFMISYLRKDFQEKRDVNRLKFLSFDTCL